MVIFHSDVSLSKINPILHGYPLVQHRSGKPIERNMSERSVGGWKTHVFYYWKVRPKSIEISMFPMNIYELPIVHGMWITTFHHPKSIEHPILHGLIPTIDSYLPITSHNKSHENGISQVETTSTLKRCQKDSSGTATCGSTSETRRKRKSCHG